MNRNQAKELLPIIKAFAEGKAIQLKTVDKGWQDIHSASFDSNPKNYRIKPEPKYRPFKDAEECWQEMLKHQPFGWLKGKEETVDTYFIITGLTNDTSGVTVNIHKGWSFYGLFSYYIFADGTPFGILEEE